MLFITGEWIRRKLLIVGDMRIDEVALVWKEKIQLVVESVCCKATKLVADSVGWQLLSLLYN